MISTSEILEFIKYNEENQENESSHRSSEVQREPKRVGIKDPTERVSKLSGFIIIIIQKGGQIFKSIIS